MEDRILIVDDDPHLTAAFRRQMRNLFEVEIAASADDGLAVLNARGPFAVVISDMHMPGMDGIRFLARVREVAPETVRIMLTGHADLATAIESVNEGNIFRFLTKPCAPELMQKVVMAAVAQYRLVTAERELLENTLSGAVKMLSDVLSLVNPTAFGRAHRLHRLVQMLAKQLRLANAWELEMAALLSQVGCVTVPEPVLRKVFQAAPLSEDERRMVAAHPRIGHDLIAHIPRMEGVARAIAHQEERFSAGRSGPESELPVGARILKIVTDYDSLESRGLAREQAMAEMRRREGWYDPALLRAFENALILREAGEHYDLREVRVSELSGNMVFAEDVYSTGDLLLVSKGQEVTVPILLRLRNFLGNAAIREPIRVLVPSQTGAAP